MVISKVNLAFRKWGVICSLCVYVACTDKYRVGSSFKLEGVLCLCGPQVIKTFP